MPTSTQVRQVSASSEKIAALFESPDTIGLFYAFVARTESSEGVSTWFLKDQQRRITRTKGLQVRITQEGMRLFNVRGEGEHLHIESVVELLPVADGTEVSHTLTMEVKGMIRTVLNKVISANIAGQAKAFLMNIERYFNSDYTD
ncbi:MAG: hypothetical protein ACE5H4_06850 [Candidatus Thorarchaeota archaeon]